MASKKCSTEGCEKEIKEAYENCFAHHQKEGVEKVSTQWHKDPVVDALLKLNANLGRQNQFLEQQTEVLRNIRDTLEDNGKSL